MEEIQEKINNGGVLLIDKPLEWTSFDVVKKIRFATKVKKIGHAGTLDPLATGLLILCFGKHTKKIESIQSQEKVYSGEFQLGKTTPSFDLETEVNGLFDLEGINQGKIDLTIKDFMGEIDQVPPIYSAVKIDGKRAYAYARSGEEVEIKSKKVTIYDFGTKLENDVIHFTVRCSKGTYIRSLANDLGKALGCGAYLKSLRREKIGDFDVENSSLPIEISNLDLLLEKSFTLKD